MTTRERLQTWYNEEKAASRAEGLQEGLEKGIRKGRSEGQRNLLAKQLQLKFGPLDAATEERLAGATQAQLSRWAERVLTAGSLEEILA
jgi:flagellar biosynthesis/type III secretory pathway protein FliH